MKIKINKKSIEVTSFDDDLSLLQKYATSETDALPSFFRIDSRSEKLIGVEDIRDALVKISAEKLVSPEIIESLRSEYPSLSKKEIGVLWLIVNEIDPLAVRADIHLAELRKIDRLSFLTPAKASNSIEEFEKEVKKQRARIQAKLKSEEKVWGELDAITGVEMGSFDLEEISMVTMLSLPNGEGLLDIFEKMDASRTIPFILATVKGVTYYKVYDEIVPPLSWIGEAVTYDGIYFKVLNTAASASRKRGLMTNIENLYSNAEWFSGDAGSGSARLETTFTARPDTSDEIILQRIFGAFGTRLDYKILSSRQTSIKGIFKISPFTFGPIIFADLVATNELINYFIFFNEKNKTITTKDFYAYYLPDHQYAGMGSRKTLAFTVTPDGNAGITIRIIRAVNVQQALAVRATLSKLFGLYVEKYDEIAEIYSELVPEAKIKPLEAKRKKKEDKKTGPRAMALREFDPKVFPPRYPDQCQKEKQPYIVKTKEEAAKLAKKLGDPHKVMPFGEVYYACEPRLQDDKNAKHIWPGLKENTSATGDRLADLDYIKTAPLLPCCYIQDQYKKKASKWRLYLENEGEVESQPKEKEAGVGYIVKAANRLQPGRYGELPFNFEKLFRYLGIEKIFKGKQEFYPVLRRGVAQSPDSFIHCMATAFDAPYLGIPKIAQQLDYIMNIRASLAERSLVVAKQELYDMTLEEIKEELLDPDAYIAPENYVSLLENFYECNIFIFIVSNDNPNGEIVLPRFSEAHLPRDLDENRRTAIIIKYESGVDDFPYQCELACLVEVKNNRFSRVDTYFENDLISRAMTQLYYNSNDVFIVSDAYDLYRPVPELGE